MVKESLKVVVADVGKPAGPLGDDVRVSAWLLEIDKEVVPVSIWLAETSEEITVALDAVLEGQPAPTQRVAHSEPEQDVVSDDDGGGLARAVLLETDDPPGVVVELALGVSSEAEVVATDGWLDADAEDRILEVAGLVREVPDVPLETKGADSVPLEVLDEEHPKPVHKVDPDDVLLVPVSVVEVDWLCDREEELVGRVDVWELDAVEAENVGLDKLVRVVEVPELDDWTTEPVVDVAELSNVDRMEGELKPVVDEADEIDNGDVVGGTELDIVEADNIELNELDDDDWTREPVVEVAEVCGVDEMEVELERVGAEMDESEAAKVVERTEPVEEANGEVGVSADGGDVEIWLEDERLGVADKDEMGFEVVGVAVTVAVHQRTAHHQQLSRSSIETDSLLTSFGHGGGLGNGGGFGDCHRVRA
ncbi:MAG: hypothetical protein LQ344_005489 [Seirophora lacunosa]|nr:MAG: hypothetical protein LQ344_005489 [Seirophora lacunosa]